MEIDAIAFKKFLRRLFTGLSSLKYDLTKSLHPEYGYDHTNSNQICFNSTFDNLKIEFGNQVVVYGTPDNNSGERQIFIARSFAQEFSTETLVDYTNPEDPSPYYVIIFNGAKCYLGDHCHTNFGEDGNEKIKILKELVLPDNIFDEFGNLMPKHH